MKPDPQVEARRWLAQAEDDLKAAQFNIEGGFYAQSCFLAQQASEKALKALLYRGGARFAFGHSVVEHVDKVAERHPHLSAHREVASRLDLYYIAPRYPNAHPGVELAPFQIFGREQAVEGVGWADGIITDVAAIIKS